MWTRTQLCSPLCVDALTLRVPGSPAANGFKEDDRGCWRRPGWRAAEQRDAAQMPWTRATADDVELLCAGRTTLAWASNAGGHVTRLDLRRDVLGAPVTDALIAHCAGARGCVRYMQSQTGVTLYAGGRRSALMLRIYRKYTETSPIPPSWLAHQWTDWGWTGGDEPVTRVEYELKREALEGLTLDVLARPAQRAAWVAKAWADALARLRLTAAPTGEYSDPSKAPTATGWHVLGDAAKAPRKRRATSAHLAMEERLARILREYEDAGVDVGVALALAGRAYDGAV